MKKLSILMALVLMLVAIVPVSATTSATPTLDDALIAHFDFSTTKTISNLVRPVDASGYGAIENFFHESTTLENGVATMAGGNVAYMSMNNYGDFADCTTGMGAFLAFNPTAVTDNWVTLFSAGTASHPVFRILLIGNTLKVQHDFGNSGAHELVYSNVEANEWLWVAASVNYSSDNSTLTLNMFISADQGKTWSTESKIENIAKVTHPTQISVLRVGKGLANNSGCEMTDAIHFDDLRIYNKALTADEVKSISIESTPNSVQIQKRTNTENSSLVDLRFVAELNLTEAQLNAYTNVGYEIVVKNSQNEVIKRDNVALTTVYTSVKAAGEPVTAADLGCDYLAAFAITGIPQTEALTFEITPYTVSNGRTYYEPTSTYNLPAAA